MAENVTIRAMEPEDVEHVTGLEAESFSVPWSSELLSCCLSSPFDKVWVLEVCGGGLCDTLPERTIVGYCNFRVVAGEGELMRIAVLKAYRGRGFARNLMEILASDARENEVTAITLEVRASNLSAINLYKSCGFEIEAVRKSYYTHPVEDALIMWNRHV